MRKIVSLTIALLICLTVSSSALASRQIRDEPDTPKQRVVRIIKKILPRWITVQEDVPLPPRPAPCTSNCP